MTNENELKIIQNNLIYIINEENQSAALFGHTSSDENLNIPNSINYKSKEYKITKILNGALKDSLVYRNSVDSLSTLHLTIPSSVTELEDGWCQQSKQLTKVTIMPENEHFTIYDNKLIIGKSNINSTSFDTLYFASRDIEKVTLPTFIKRISSYAFENCSKLRQIHVPKNSELQVIEKNAFYGSSIESFTIPPHLTYIGSQAFQFCNHLTSLEVSDDSKLKEIGEESFWGTFIESVKIPSSVERIEKCAFSRCTALRTVDIACDSSLKYIGKSAFIETSIEKVFIPPNLTEICNGTFSYCNKLKNIVIPENSQLKRIGDFAFKNTSIEKIVIPRHVSRICKESFYGCKMNEFEFCRDSELRVIEENAFAYSNLSRLTLPSCVEELGDGFLNNVSRPVEVTVFLKGEENIKVYDGKYIVGKSDIKSDVFDVLHFTSQNIRIVKIPSFVRIIGPYAFSGLSKLRKVLFTDDSKLEIIGKKAFSVSSIRCISIPPHVTEIGDSAFSGCTKLTCVDIPANSELKTIGNYAFNGTKIMSIFIPSRVARISEGAFAYSGIQKVEIAEDSEMTEIEKNAFVSSAIECLVLPPKVTEIGEKAFCVCRRISTIEIRKNSEMKQMDEKKVFGYGHKVCVMVPEEIKGEFNLIE